MSIEKTFISTILKYPKSSLGISFSLFLLSLFGFFNFSSDFTPRIWFSDNDPIIQNLDQFEKRFGTDQIIIIGVSSKNGILNNKTLKITEEITEKLWSLHSIYRVDSISNFNYIESSNDDITISPLFDPFVVKSIKNKINNSKELENILLSQDKKMTLIQAQLKPLFGEAPELEKIMHELNNILAPYKNESDVELTILGSVPITHAFKRISITDNLKIVPTMLFLIFIILLFYFKSFLGVLVPLLVSLFSIVGTFGFLGHMSYVFNSLLSAIPGIILAICLADTIHLLTTFFEEKKLGATSFDAIKKSMEKNFLATVLTTITTIVSFFSISFTDIIPINNLGILAAIGSFLAWFNTYTLLPPLILLFPNAYVYKRKKGNKPIDKLKENDRDFFDKLTNFILNYRRFIITFFTLLSLGSFYLSLQNEVNSDPVKYFAEETLIKKHYNKAKEHFEGIRGISIEIDSGRSDGVKDADFLKRVDLFLNEIKQDKDIINTNSIISVLKRMNKYLLSGADRDYKIPEDRYQISESLMLYSLGLPQGLGTDNFISLDNRYLKVDIKWSTETTNESIIKHDKVYKLAGKYKLKLNTGGYFPIYVAVNELVVKSFINSMLTAVAFVSLIILLVFRNIKLALLAMLPNIIPLSVGAAFMSLSNIYVDIGTSIVCAICLGIAVDDTIHFITHFQKNSIIYKDPLIALNKTLHSTGRALVLTTLLLVCGFGSFVMAEFLPNHYFGILCAIVLSFALLTDLLFLPAILLPRKKDL